MGDSNHKWDIELNGSLYKVKPLHEVPDLINECCEMINMEWKRSHTARLRSIEGSCENFPMSLILIKNTGKPQVVGHCKVSRVSMSNNKVFVETVVIHPSLRSKGLGKFLMNKTEEVCRSKNIKWVYLATKGQEGFYEKLGYTQCPPISIYGCQGNDLDEDIYEGEKQIKPVLSSMDQNKMINTSPPPPPLPEMFLKTIFNNTPCSKTFLRKQLF